MATKKMPVAAAVDQAVPRVQLFVCDDIRHEVDGKLSLIGLYSDGVVIVGLGDDEMRGTTGKPEIFSIDGLAFLVTVTGLRGKHELIFQFEEGAFPPKEPAVRVADFEEGKGANLVARFRPYLSSSFGRKRVALSIDGKVNELFYEIRRGAPRNPAQQVAPPARGSSPRKASAKSVGKK
jgi:hypothetical protein